MTDPNAPRSVSGTLAAFEAWLHANPTEAVSDATAATARLGDLFARVERAGASLHDPDAAVLRWILRDLARDQELPRSGDPGVDDDHDGYVLSIATLARYILFLRSHGLWRRSERAVQDCWDVLDWASREPLGIDSFGATVDGIIADGLAARPADAEVVAAAGGLRFATTLGALDRLAAESMLTPDDLAVAAGLAPGSGAFELWLRGLEAVDLVHEDRTTGYVTPRHAVTEAGGRPPLDGDLLQRVVEGITRATLELAFDGDVALLPALPRGTTTLITLVAACGDGEEDDEDAEGPAETTAQLVRSFVEQIAEADGGPVVEAAVADVMRALEALVELGVLRLRVLERSGSEHLEAVPALRPRILRTISDFTGLTGGPDDAVPGWTPVELPYPFAQPTGLTVEARVEGGDAVLEARVDAWAPVGLLLAMVTGELGWRGLRRFALCDADGVRRFAHTALLRDFGGAGDGAIVDSRAVAIGSVLRAVGDEAVVEYEGGADAVWRVRVRVTEVGAQVESGGLLLGRHGTPPVEQSLLGEFFTRRAPQGLRIPDALERGWAFMEAQGWRPQNEHGFEMLTPGPSWEAGAVFTSGIHFGGWFGEESRVHLRLLPLGVSARGEAALLCLWLDDEGRTAFVGVERDPAGGVTGHVLAESGDDILRLLAVGYPAITSTALGSPADHADALAATERLRAWVREVVGLDVPDAWPAPASPDRFGVWLAAWLAAPPTT